MASKKKTSFIDKALELTGVKLSTPEVVVQEEELLSTVAPPQKVEVPIAEIAKIEPLPSPKVEQVLDRAYNVTYSEANRKYMLTTIEYSSDGTARVLGTEVFATGLNEVHFKIGKIFLDKLAKLLYGRHK